jgi:hypothetical protein
MGTHRTMVWQLQPLAILRRSSANIRQYVGGQPHAAKSAGDLSALGQDADRVGAVEALSVPSRGGGICRDICVLIFEWPGVSIRRASNRCAQVATVGADEAEPARAGGEDLELSGVMGHVVAFTQQQGPVLAVGHEAV